MRERLEYTKAYFKMNCFSETLNRFVELRVRHIQIGVYRTRDTVNKVKEIW